MTDHVDPRIEAAAKAIHARRFPEASSRFGWNLTHPEQQAEALDYARAALAAADKAATIKTVEELDALPIESVILDCEGYPYRRVRQYPDVPSSWEGYELGEHLDVDTIDFPARVIHWGTE